MKKYPVVLSILAVLFAGSSVYSGLMEPARLRVYIRMDKRVFFSDEDVTLYVCVKNISPENNYFEVYDPGGGASSTYTTFQPVVFDMKGRTAELTVPYMIENRKIRDLLKLLDKRLVELGPGEIFTHTINLKAIYNLRLKTGYRVTCHFNPSFEDNASIDSDNTLSFRVIEEKRYNKPSELAAVQRSLSPTEVMLLTLNAEQSRDWGNWIKFINIQKYINAFPEFVQRYNRANFEEKARIEKEFITYATRERDDYLLDFKIVKEVIEKNREIAYVEVEEDRFGTRKPFRYRNRFKLEKYENMWLVTDEEATVMKGAKQ